MVKPAASKDLSARASSKGLTKASTKASTKATVKEPIENGQVSLTCVERKRRDTRDRILRQAEVLMRSRPVDEVTIQDITEAADIGHGTFYLHFKSKYEVLIPIIRQEAIRWDEIIQERLSDSQDPAIVLASSSRYMARIIAADPLWRWFLQHSGMPVEDMRKSVGRFGVRDFTRGLVSGRFKVPELGIASRFMLGGFVAGVLASFDSAEPDKTIDQMVEMFLRTIGLDCDEAARIANLPLAELE
jgi:AcrR family transcriptional regulator